MFAHFGNLGIFVFITVYLNLLLLFKDLFIKIWLLQDSVYVLLSFITLRFL